MVTLICVIVTQQIERDGKRFAKGSQGLWLAVGATKLSFRKPWCPGPFAGLMALFNWVNWVCHFALGDKTSKENDEQFLFTCGQGIRECASCPCKCFLARLQWFMYIYIYRILQTCSALFLSSTLNTQRLQPFGLGTDKRHTPTSTCTDC